MRIFLAGASGAIGKPLVRQLVAAGHDVVASSRTEAKQQVLRELGARPVLMDGLDAESVGAALAAAEPEVVIHQMTALTGMKALKHFDREFAVTNRLRTEGTDHLIAAAVAAGARRLIVSSFTGWPSERTGGPVKTETDPLDPNPPAEQRESLAAIRHLERVTLAAPLETVVLRYGLFYGEGAWDELYVQLRKRRFPVVGDGAGVWSWIHVADAASATAAAVERGSGVYNIVDDHPAVIRELLPGVAELIGAPRPRHLPVWLARPIAGEVGISMLTRVRGSSNAKARRELGWAPHYPSWREGVRDEILLKR